MSDKIDLVDNLKLPYTLNKSFNLIYTCSSPLLIGLEHQTSIFVHTVHVETMSPVYETIAYVAQEASIATASAAVLGILFLTSLGIVRN